MNFYYVTFLLFPIVAIFVKELLKLKIPYWLIFALWVPFGWLLLNLATQAEFEMLDEIIRNTPNPSDQVIDRWQESSRREQDLALLLGWAMAVTYFCFYVPLIYIVRFIKKIIVKVNVYP